MNIQWLPKAVAILLVIDAIVVLFRPDLLKKFCQLFSEGATIYIAAIIYALIGIAFLFGVSDKCNIQWLVIAFGIIALAGAVFIVAVPQKGRIISNWLGAKSTTILRLYALIYLAVAALLVYSS